MPPAAKKPEGPKYGDLVKGAILALKDRTGSSLVAITKCAAYPRPSCGTLSARAHLAPPLSARALDARRGAASRPVLRAAFVD